MHARPAHDWTIEELAREVGASRSVLAERFTDLVGMPPMHYLANWRMQIAVGPAEQRHQYRHRRRRYRLRLGGRLQPRLQEDGRRSALGLAPARSSTPLFRAPHTGFIPSMTDHEIITMITRGLGALGDGSAGPRPADHPDREGLHRRSGPRRDRRGLRDQDRPAYRRPYRGHAPGPILLSVRRCSTDASKAARAVRPRRQGRRPSGRGREYARAAQHGRLHPVLLLPVGCAGAAAGLVQVLRLSLARGEGAARAYCANSA